jgi:hypothetical protein
MRNSKFLLAILCAVISGECMADTPVYPCGKCRGFTNYYEDAGNYAFNAVFGADPFIGITPGMQEYTQPLLIENQYGQVGGVYFLDLFGFDSAITIRVEKPNGVLKEYEVLRTRIGKDLGVGEEKEETDDRQPGTGGGPGGGGGNGGGGSGGSNDDGSTDRVCGTTQVDDGEKRRTCQRR